MAGPRPGTYHACLLSIALFFHGRSMAQLAVLFSHACDAIGWSPCVRATLRSVIVLPNFTTMHLEET